MFSKIAIFALIVAFGAAQNLAFLGQTGGFGFGGGDVEDQMILKNLVRLDAGNAPLARRLLQLNVAGREVVGNLARGINHVIIKKGNMYSLTLLDRVLKIKGQNTPFGFGQNPASRNLQNNWIQTEIDDKEILEDLIQVDNADPQIVDSLLMGDVVDRKITSDLAQAINQKTIQNGPAYPQVLLQKLVQINGGSPSGKNPFGGVPRGISGRPFGGAFGGTFGGPFERTLGGVFARNIARNMAFSGTTNPTNIYGGVF